ncbi:NAD(P)-binding protein [Hypoxylon sp. FL1284]|nr:NAD(P)-binding protein [Hypoxylon sp. FL1284]
MDNVLGISWTNLGIALFVVLISAITMGAFLSKNHMPVDGKTVLLTGASEGMGRSAALQLAAKGANLVLVSRSADKLAAVVAECRAAARDADAQRFTYLTADVSQADYAAPLLAEATAWNGGRAPDVVWCVAGTSTPDFWFEAPLARSRAQMDINYWGAAEMAHAVLRQWCAPDAPGTDSKDEPARHLVFTSSVLAFFPVVGYGPYTPAKSALRGLADTLAQELEAYPRPVRVHVVYPGSISSPGFARENRTKPAVTRLIEEGDPVQTPDVVAAAAIAGLERGQYAITVAFLGHVLRWTAQAGSPRNNWLIDTLMACLMPIVWIFALPDIYSKIRKYRREHGHPATYRNKDIQDHQN